MRVNKFQKIIIYCLLFVQAGLWPSLSLAFTIGTTSTGSVNPIPINDSGSLTDNASFNTDLSAIKAADKICHTGIEKFESGDSIKQLAFSFSSLLGGDGAYATQLQAEITAYNLYLTCEQDVLSDGIPVLNLDLQDLVAPNSYTSTIKQQYITQVAATIATYKDKLKTAQGRFNVASQNIWKALLITVLINTTKAVADQLVTELVNSYKIANVKAYTDSLATMAYDNQFIRDNFPDNQGQMMARAILTNPLYQMQIQPGIYAAADSALGFNPSTLSVSDPNYYAKMAMAGSANANPYYLQTAYVSAVNQARANSISTAQAYISQGNGYKAPVNCAGSMVQQSAIDQQTRAASDRLANRKALLNDLTQAQTAGQKVSASDLARAQADYNAALAAWNQLPNTVAGVNSNTQSGSLSANLTSGSNSEGAAAIVMCEAISSPAVLINQGIDAVFKSMSDNLAQYNSNNLPGFLSAISGIATQIGSSLVLGGLSGMPTTVNEQIAANQAVSVASAAAVQTYYNDAAANLQKGISEFDAAPTSALPSGYTITWNVLTSKIPNASYVTISGNGFVGTAKQPLSGSWMVSVGTSATYTLTVYDASGKPLTTGNLTITAAPTATQPLTYNAGSPKVAGAFTNQPVLDVRGPAAVISPRGE